MNEKNKSTIPEIEALSDDALADVAGGIFSSDLKEADFKVGQAVRLKSGGNFQCQNCSSTGGSGNQKAGIIRRVVRDAQYYTNYYIVRCAVCNSILDENGDPYVDEWDLTLA